MEIIPAIYSRTKQLVPCGVDLDCDDGIWCNGTLYLSYLNCWYLVCECSWLQRTLAKLHPRAYYFLNLPFFHQAMRHAIAWGYVSLAHNGRALMDCFAPMTSAMNLPNHVKTLPPTALHRVISVPRINASNLLAGVNSPAVPPWIHGRFCMTVYLELLSGVHLKELSVTNILANMPNKTERPGSLLEAPTNMADLYARRMKGWLVPPVTGDYVFWIAADDIAELWLSTNDHPANRVLVCFLTYRSEPRQWTAYPEQES
jgi:hypothetical protein